MLELVAKIANSLERIATAMEQEPSTSIATIQPEALSKEDAARFLGVDEATIEHLIRVRKLAFVQYGEQRGRVIPVEALRQFLEDNRQATAGELMGRRKKA